MLIGRALANALAFTSSSHWLLRLSKNNIDKEKRRHNLAIKQLQKAQIEWTKANRLYKQATQVLCTYHLKDYSIHGNKASILCLASEYYLLTVLPAKLYCFEIGPVDQKVWSFKCTMCTMRKTLNSNFLE